MSQVGLWLSKAKALTHGHLLRGMPWGATKTQGTISELCRQMSEESSLVLEKAGTVFKIKVSSLSKLRNKSSKSVSDAPKLFHNALPEWVPQTLQTE